MLDKANTTYSASSKLSDLPCLPVRRYAGCIAYNLQIECGPMHRRLTLSYKAIQMLCKHHKSRRICGERYFQCSCFVNTDVRPCRQKTAGRKTECSCGRGTGVWCGSCLNTRMGQNIDEIFQMSDWSCPSCLEICNCSGRTCDRHNAHLGCTRILSGEAREQGYKSVSQHAPASVVKEHLAACWSSES